MIKDSTLLASRGSRQASSPGISIATPIYIMKIKIQGCFLLLAALSIGLTNCAPKKAVDDRSRASQLITQGRYNEAIAIMDPAVRANPEDQKSRVLLASAYAAQAGIFLSGFLGLADEIVRESKSRDAQVASEANALIYDQLRKSAKSPEQLRIVNVAQAIFMASMRMNTIIRLFNAVPDVMSPQAQVNLRAAIEILDGDDFEGGPALYRGLLRIVLIKNYIQSRLDLSYLSRCNVDFDRLIVQLGEMRTMFARVFNDFILGTVDPARKQQMVQASQRFDIDLSNAIDTLKSVNMPGALDLSFVYKQLNAKCER